MRRQFGERPLGRRRKDCVSFSGTVELGEREGRKKLVTPRTLLLRDGDGRLVGYLGGRGVRGIALQPDIAVQAVQEAVHPMFPGPACLKERVFDRGLGVCLALRKQCSQIRLAFAMAASSRRISCCRAIVRSTTERGYGSSHASHGRSYQWAIARTHRQVHRDSSPQLRHFTTELRTPAAPSACPRTPIAR